jgi:hypothetical protein
MQPKMKMGAVPVKGKKGKNGKKGKRGKRIKNGSK